MVIYINIFYTDGSYFFLPLLLAMAMGVLSIKLVSVLLSSASSVGLGSWGEAGVTLTSTLFCSCLMVSRYSAIT